jgi:hypothetical protein
MKVNQSTSFVYKWTHSLSGMWYIGSRTAKGCHLNDGYICSSRSVKSLILKNSLEWSREILGVGTPEEMRKLEADYLISLDAANNPLSYNLHNNNGKFNFAGGIPQSASHIQKRSKSLKGIIRSAEYCTKMSLAKKGKPNPKLSVATKGKSKPNVSKAKKGVPQPKVLCRLIDRKEMCLSHFNRWCNRQDDPAILMKIFKKLKGVPKTKIVCRIIDKKELTLGRFNTWLAKVS